MIKFNVDDLLLPSFFDILDLFAQVVFGTVDSSRLIRGFGSTPKDREGAKTLSPLYRLAFKMLKSKQ